MNLARSERWKRLLTTTRLFHDPPEAAAEGRSDFERDHDRVVFSSAFRRLKDKTQVFPLSPSDYTRTRLTHSLEASCVGRSLGQEALLALRRAGRVADTESPGIATLVATACLAHDIGNPPFGHSGEDAICKWAASHRDMLKLTEGEQLDVENFEGNAQGFRIMARLTNRLRRGGIQPTVALLGAMTKYPRSSSPPRPAVDGRASEKKYGFFRDDEEAALHAFRELGMVERAPGMFARHPLAFLTEAADDICYVVMDLEDAFKLKLVTFDVASDWLKRLTTDPKPPKGEYRSSSELSRLRASAVHSMTMACAKVFEDNLEAIEDGTFDTALIAATKFAADHKALKRFEQENVYTDKRALQIEYAGYETLGGLLTAFCDAALAGEQPTRKQEKLLRLLPDDSFDRPGIPKNDRLALTTYQRVLAMTDFVSGMTDTYAVELYQRLSGIQLPA
jgi:dGTPase